MTMTMTMTTTAIDDINLHNGAMNDPVSENPTVLERSAARCWSHEPVMSPIMTPMWARVPTLERSMSLVMITGARPSARHNKSTLSSAVVGG
jgi:hypothetical protein